MSDSEVQVNKNKQQINDGQNDDFKRLFCETQSTDSNQRMENKAAERSRLYRERHREEINQRRKQQRQQKADQVRTASFELNYIHSSNYEIEQIPQETLKNQPNSRTQRQQRYYERHKEEINKRKKDSRGKHNILQAIPATAAERNRNYRKRHGKEINERRRDSRHRRQNTDNDSRDIDESVEPIVSMQDNTAEQNESSNASHVDDSNVKEEVSSKTTSKDPGKCLCGSVLDTMMKHKWEKDEIAYKTRILMKNKKINNLQKINARLHKKNTIVKNMLKMLKRNKYVDPLVLREISFHVTEDRPDQDLLDIKEEEIEDNELSPTREAEKDSLQVNEHNFMEDSIPIKLEVIDDSENDIEAGNSFYAENTAGNQQENVFTPQTILSTQNMITIDLPPIDGAMEADNQTNILYKSTNVLDEYDKWALKIANQIKIMTNVEEKVNLLNATQSLVDAFLAKDANTSLKTAHSKSDEAVFQSFVKPNKKIFVPSMLPVMGGILIPQQGTSNEEMSPQAVQIEPTMLSNLIQAQKQNE